MHIISQDNDILINIQNIASIKLVPSSSAGNKLWYIFADKDIIGRYKTKKAAQKAFDMLCKCLGGKEIYIVPADDEP